MAMSIKCCKLPMTGQCIAGLACIYFAIVIPTSSFVVAVVSTGTAQVEIKGLSKEEAQGVMRDNAAMASMATSLLGATSVGNDSSDKSHAVSVWGSTRAASVSALCRQLVATGLVSFNATISLNGKTKSTGMKVASIGGCFAAGPASVDGVQATLQDNDARRIALICPTQRSDVQGCDLFSVGDYTSNLSFKNSAAASTVSVRSR